MYRRIFICISAALLAFALCKTEKEKVVDTLADIYYSDAEQRAYEFIKALELDKITMHEDVGDGTVYKKRYYCSNFCIDLLYDGSIRYVSDINDADGEDRFLKWLYKGGKAEVISESNVYGFVLRNVKKGAINCQLCIEREEGRVVAARIIFNS